MSKPNSGRQEAHIAFPYLLQCFREIELRESELVWSERLSLRGLKHLNVVLHAAGYRTG